MDIIKLLNPDNTVSFNRRLAHAIGLNETLIYSALISKQVWYERNSMLTPDGWFYSTVEDLHESTCLSGYQQNRCISHLVKLGLILCKKRGIPARRYFCVPDSPELLSTFLSGGETPENPRRNAPENSATGSEVTSQQEVKKLENKKSSLFAASDEVPAHKTKGARTEEKETSENNFKSEPKSDLLISTEKRICADRLTEKYGDIFSELACRTVADGISGKFRLHRKGRVISVPEVISAYQRIDYDCVCHVADYMAENHGIIRSIPAYLRTALYTTIQEAYAPGSPSSFENCERDFRENPLSGIFSEWKPLKRRDSSIDLDDVMNELREQYSN